MPFVDRADDGRRLAQQLVAVDPDSRSSWRCLGAAYPRPEFGFAQLAENAPSAAGVVEPAADVTAHRPNDPASWYRMNGLTPPRRGGR